MVSYQFMPAPATKPLLHTPAADYKACITIQLVSSSALPARYLCMYSMGVCCVILYRAG